MNDQLLKYIKASPTPFGAIDETARMLREAGFEALSESDDWDLEAGKGYYVTRNGSSLMAFRVPGNDFKGFMITASHCDSPCFKIKENAEISGENYTRISAEVYGGLLEQTWLDRPLSVAGRLILRTDTGIATVLVDMEEPCLIIPNVAPHINRDSKGGPLNYAVDLVPLYRDGEGKDSFKKMIADKAGVDADSILTSDLFVYNPQPGLVWGDFVSAPRLDDLQCAFSATTAFINAQPSGSAQVLCVFDNEEVGSRTKQGAASTFIKDVLRRVSQCFGANSSQFRQLVANSFLVSCDNAHALHPNHPELHDKNHSVTMNGGVVIKYNASQSYTSDGVSAGIFKMICDEAEVPCQLYANRADIRGGGTLGNIANTQVSLNSVDIGIAQLAMHSSFETAGARDTQNMITALTAFYSKTLIMESDGVYTLE